MKGNEQHEKMMPSLVELRLKLCIGPSTTEDGASQGKVLFFNPEQQQYGVLWTVESEVQNPLEYVGLERLLGLLVNADMKEIVSTLMDFEKNRVSSTSTPSTSDAKAPQDNASSHIVATAPSASSAASNKRMPVPADTGQKSKEMLETEAAAGGAANQSMLYPATR